MANNDETTSPVIETATEEATADKIAPTESNSADTDQTKATSDVDYLTPVHWQATEYIQRAKGQMWYVIMLVVVLGLMAIAIFVMQSWSFAILVPVMAAALVVYSRRPPHEASYTLSRQGLHIDDALHPYGDFKAFALVEGDDQHQIMLIPTKRFNPGLSVYFPEEVGERIVDMLAARLPMREQHLDAIDRLVRKLHI